MASVNVISLRKGHAVRHNNEVCLVIEHELKTPPRMASYVQMSVRSVASKKVSNLRMTSNDSLEGVHLEKVGHEFSYKDTEGYHFLHPETYDDMVVYEDLIEDVKNYLIDGQLYTLLIADGLVVAIELPMTMVIRSMAKKEQRRNSLWEDIAATWVLSSSPGTPKAMTPPPHPATAFLAT